MVFFCTLALGSFLLPNAADNGYLAKRAQNFLLSEHELKKRREGRLAYCLSQRAPRFAKVGQFNRLFAGELKKMLLLMGSSRSAEQFVADALLKSCLMSLSLLMVPLITGFSGYLLLAPLGFFLVFALQVRGVHVAYKRWQNSLIKDLPLLVDKIQISLEAGKPIIHALQQVNSTAGPRLARMLGDLLLDMQTMRQAEALDRFARSTAIPEMLSLSAAVKIAVENGYDKARHNFDSLKLDIRKLRVTGLNELTRSKPGKLWRLQLLMALNAALAMGFTFFFIFAEAASGM